MAYIYDFNSAGFREQSQVMAPGGNIRLCLDYLQRGSAALREARTAETADAIELAYLAAVRAASAAQALRPPRKRYRSRVIWAKLRQVAPEYTDLADFFEERDYACERVRVGMDRNPSSDFARELIDAAADFLARVELESGVLPLAA
ncbi:hypothetical protein KRX51_09945 [Corynebacterium sp. TAE3-ERU12]|uniref:SAV_6107 family HEPN domain-containing protein n=1 Tax=Corynebacterium sp. TAE3-ERU12 TaxID=2849491 RepID=UPI001C45B453|nr:SAV_6107 family HEPN domain-containing protein [Corynebacterium sp. TAE3-ERU12]MBV7296232.1 hypothetical protein [Corynebacterium sp. TAE3-ERU12]